MEEKIAESQEALTKGSWKDFFSVDKMMDWGMNLAAILIIILIGLILLKIILRITDRGLKKSTADPILYTFVRNVIKVAAAIVLITMCLGSSGHSSSYDRGCYRGRRSSYCSGSQGQSG